MRRATKDELLRNFLAINAMLRGEAQGVRRRIEARRSEHKSNPFWRLQPRAPMGTAEGGRWVDGAGSRTNETLLKPTAGESRDDEWAAIGATLQFELSRGEYTRALEVTQDAQARMRIANDRAARARQAFGNFANEEIENAYSEEMRTRRGRIALGSTDLSERAVRLRRRPGAPVGDGQNVSVIEYRDARGQLHYIERISGDGLHAEEVAVLELQRLRIPPGDVTRIYTDRQPCLERCRGPLRRYINARVTWAVDWPDNDETGRELANRALQRQIRRYYRVESQDTLPMPLPRYPSQNGNAARPSRRRRRR